MMSGTSCRLRPCRFIVISGCCFLLNLLNNSAWVCFPIRARYVASRAQSRIQLRQQMQHHASIVPSFNLDKQQQEAVDAVMDGHSVLITGGAGVGKSATTKAIIEKLTELHGDDEFVVTASTGVSAVLMGGCTLHCAAGIGVPRLVSDFKKIRNEPYKSAWRNLKALIIDEVSMLSGEFFDQFEKQIRELRDNDQPFGGLQLVLVGDFAQLPPVATKPPDETWKLVDQTIFEQSKQAFIPKGPRSRHELFLNRGMLFQSRSFWHLLDEGLRVISLTTPHRQRSDHMLSDLLQHLRNGSISDRIAAINRLNARCYHPSDTATFCCNDDNEHVWLYGQNQVVDIKNTERLDALPHKPVTFSASDQQIPEEAENQTVFEARIRVLADSTFFDKHGRGCGVPEKLVLKTDARVMLCANVATDEGLVNGVTGRVVALSKGRKMSSKYVKVDFEGLGPKFIRPHTFQSKIPGVGTCKRKQIPLRLAWAMTHHRSQGKTLTKAKVDPGAFTYGQAYVAVSRVQALEDLTLLARAKLSDFKVNPAVHHWMQFLQNHHTAREKIGDWRQEILPWMMKAPAQQHPWPSRC
mmetsp:Transcript_129189/g.251543  ORF Transcript_129189/g.251543 Transcript_129189/m.251543 type:complete len:580 (+) Transcript_129189:77-1816(+)